MNGQKKWRAVLPVLPVLPSNPSACARSNESCLSGDPAYRRVCTRGRQYPPSLAPSLARPEFNGRKRTERDGTERNGTERLKKRGKREEKRNGTERDGTDNKTEWDGNGAFFLTPTVCSLARPTERTHAIAAYRRPLASWP